MTLDPLLSASPQVTIHALTAIAAFLIGTAQVALPKRTLSHRAMGWIWVVLMTIVALSSFWIHTLCQFGPFSAIHGLSLLTLVLLPVGVLHARRHSVSQHRRVMLWLFVGALLVAGVFTLWPGRIMHDVVFGTATRHGACI